VRVGSSARYRHYTCVESRDITLVCANTAVNALKSILDAHRISLENRFLARSSCRKVARRGKSQDLYLEIYQLKVPAHHHFSASLQH
jgi:hypothetical protein